MKCRFPVQLTVDKRQIFVPCGHCAWCLRSLRDEWYFRLKEEKKVHNYASFVTLTYRDEDLPSHVDGDGVLHYDVCKEHVQEFHREIRRKNKFRFLICSEYGPKTGRPHYHGIYFHDKPIRFIDYWHFGDNNTQYPAKDGSFKYVLKYTLKGSNVPEGSIDNFRLMSRKPGLGSSFNYEGQKVLLTDNNTLVKVPRFYKKGYLKSLPEVQAQMIKDSTLDYLHAIDRHADLKRRFDELIETGSISPEYSFEEYIWDLYRKDYLKQIKINNK